jgi:hypothetical protein
MNAISSGLLIFASLVELMAEDFLSDESWKVCEFRSFYGLVVRLRTLAYILRRYSEVDEEWQLVSWSFLELWG